MNTYDTIRAMDTIADDLHSAATRATPADTYCLMSAMTTIVERIPKILAALETSMTRLHYDQLLTASKGGPDEITCAIASLSRRDAKTQALKLAETLDYIRNAQINIDMTKQS